ncbi:rRNA-processing protein UTP23 homolog [Cephus cinctus]|uniref:rRNA-processing protein UTP23 homolog n=1 Tax=Cephus cinctus TaxID=211228 RepID=A0AAJ7CGH1_CEPCN|nr:rRNA-processing protein UTP23 homolog [Cephus cinctus]
MKISRHKKVQKNLAFYVNNFKFRQPYQVLIDGTFSFAALQNKFNIQDQLPKYLQAETKLLSTQCVILETEKLGSKVFGAMLIVKQFAVHKCGHEKQPVSGSKCLLSMLGKENPSRYIIATQDRDLQEHVRKVPGVPLIYLHGKAPTLEPPSQASRNRAAELRRAVGINVQQEETLKVLKEKSGLAEESDVRSKKKRKKGGPNPLSCKKKKKSATETATNTNKTGKVRKRKRVKLATHIIEALKPTSMSSSS